MPIYAYRCAACGHSKDVLQKMSDPVLTVCPSCGAGAFQKQVTAAGFQLKGSGWYVTDFRGGAKPAGEGAAGGDKKPDAAATGAKSGESAAAPAAKTEGAAASPAAGPAGSPPPASPPAAGAK